MPENEIEILYVEDNPTDVELTLFALRRSRLANRIHVARDGEEALDFLFCRGPFAGRDFCAPKFVLLDLKLPKVDGIEVLDAIRQDERTKLIPVVVMTSSKEHKDLVDSYALHVNSYIQKPVDFDQFQQIVGQLGLYWLITNQQPLSENSPQATATRIESGVEAFLKDGP
jgi:CheY-like chemotaxis protein